MEIKRGVNSASTGRLSRNTQTELETSLADAGVNRKSESVAVVDREGTLIYLNTNCAQLHGYNTDDLVGTKLGKIVENGENSYLFELFKDQEHRKVLTWKALHRKRDGDLFTVTVSAMFPGADGNTSDHIILIIRKESKNSSESRIMDESNVDSTGLYLMDSVELQAAYRQALNEALAAVIFATPDGNINYANEAATNLFGLPIEDLIGLQVKELISEEHRSEVERLLNGNTDMIRWVGEITRLRSDGRERVLKLSIMPVRNSANQPQFLICNAFDITEMRLMENHMRQAQKLEAIGLLASGLAHNINSPLSAIIMTAEIAQAKQPEIAEFDDILEAAARIGEIITNLMTKSRQEQSDEEMEINLNDLVRIEMKFLEANLFFKHGIERDVKLAKNLPSIKGYYSDFSQCFQNLISNAMDAMAGSKDCKLDVQTRLDEGNNRIILRVRDNGCGIPRAELDQIFEPFFTTKADVDSSFHARPSGTGLGLSTVKQLMSRYGASLEVNSKVGLGSEFRIIIPVELQKELIKDKAKK